MVTMGVRMVLLTVATGGAGQAWGTREGADEGVFKRPMARILPTVDVGMEVDWEIRMGTMMIVGLRKAVRDSAT